MHLTTILLLAVQALAVTAVSSLASLHSFKLMSLSSLALELLRKFWPQRESITPLSKSHLFWWTELPP